MLITASNFWIISVGFYRILKTDRFKVIYIYLVFFLSWHIHNIMHCLKWKSSYAWYIDMLIQIYSNLFGNTETYSDPSQTPETELSAKTANDWKPLTIFMKIFAPDARDSVKRKLHHTDVNQLTGFPYYKSSYRKVFPKRL